VSAAETCAPGTRIGHMSAIDPALAVGAMGALGAVCGPDELEPLQANTARLTSVATLASSALVTVDR